MNYLALQKTTSPQPSTSNMNYDILKRLANLEKAVFGDKLRVKTLVT